MVGLVDIVVDLVDIVVIESAQLDQSVSGQADVTCYTGTCYTGAHLDTRT
jgi:hypothetical protein